ncbi:MAG TPA: hypothetical protein VNQ76_21410 [Planctomicrobium sp.]|nr:hypothetical protein [Planctomicrobium sp.]
MNNHQEQSRLFETLWASFLEGELDAEGSRQLQELLENEETFQNVAVEQYEIHRLLGFLMKEYPEQSESFVQETLQKLRTQTNEFSTQTMQRIRKTVFASPSSLPATPNNKISEQKISAIRRSIGSLFVVSSGWMTAAIAIAVLFYVWKSIALTPVTPDQSTTNNSVDDAVSPADQVRFTRVARAQFFGELSPGVDSSVQSEKTYCLTSGMVELLFPRGAVAILEGPAIFRARDGECLEVDTGLCSVYAPDGAEGFQVLTPDANIVDRGTRFSIHVTDFSETEVHVIEGAADLYRKDIINPDSISKSNSPVQQEIRLTERQSARVQTSKEFQSAPMEFRADQYRKQLPDRIISYEASQGPDGGVDQLLNIRLQRNGQEITHSVDDLIPVELIWFQANEVSRDGHFLGRETLPVDRRELSSNNSLASGVINPGGSEQPLTTTPILKHDPANGIQGTPGMAFRFQKPVKNRLGPDLVLFEIHPISSPTNGDAFHISPLNFQKGRRSLTITNYDLSLLSPEALPVMHMHAHNLLNRPITSLDQLMTDPAQGRPVRLKYRALAVAIDLSDLGYEPDEEADGIFIQDAEDGHGRIDPVFIGGLP